MDAAATVGTTLDVGTNMTITGTLDIGSVPIFANNAAAKSGGLSDNAVYKTATGVLMIVYT